MVICWIHALFHAGQSWSCLTCGLVLPASAILCCLALLAVGYCCFVLRVVLLRVLLDVLHAASLGVVWCCLWRCWVLSLCRQASLHVVKLHGT